MMQAITGTPINPPIWLQELRPIQHLLFFEIPLVTLLRSSSAVNFLKVWCDTEKGIDRYLLFSISQKSLEAYRMRAYPLRSLITTPEDGFVYCIEESSPDIKATILNPQHIPVSYLPDDESFFNPAHEADVGESLTYEIALDGEWDIEGLKGLSDTFSKAFSFLFCLTQFDSGTAPAVKSALDEYPWRGGFSSMHFYTQLKHIIPRDARPQVKTIHFASPGWIEFSLDKPTACGIGTLVESYIDNANELHGLIKYINRELSRREMRGAKAKKIFDNIPPADLAYCALALDQIALLIGPQVPTLLRRLAMHDFAALKILLSFLRRIEKLAVFQIREQAHF